MNNKKVYNGIDRAKTLPLLKEGRLGLITNHSGVTRDMTPSFMFLHSEYELTALYSPEHGIYGAAQAGAKVEEVERESTTGVPVYSLYGGRTAPDEQMLDNVDILCFDIQDVGARFYTYLYTMTRSMKAAAAKGIPFVVFDRINPVGLNKVQGEILDENNASFVGEYAVPHRYGLTAGEFARFINETRDIGAELYVVPCEGLDRDTYYRDTDLCFVAPSPNMPTPETALVYTGTCIFEAVKNVSEGRGTTQPFEMIGAPYIDEQELCGYLNGYELPGAVARPVRFVPTFSKFAGELCRGIQIHVRDRDAFSPFEYGYVLISHLRALYDIQLTEAGSRRIFGTSRLYEKTPPEILFEDCRRKCEEFGRITEKYKLY